MIEQITHILTHKATGELFGTLDAVMVDNIMMDSEHDLGDFSDRGDDDLLELITFALVDGNANFIDVVLVEDDIDQYWTHADLIDGDVDGQAYTRLTLDVKRTYN